MLCYAQVNIKQCLGPAFEQKKSQKRKIEDDLDDMEIEPQMKYKGDTFTCEQFLGGRGGSTWRQCISLCCNGIVSKLVFLCSVNHLFYAAGGSGIHRPLGGREQRGADYKAKVKLDLIVDKQLIKQIVDKQLSWCNYKDDRI